MRLEPRFSSSRYLTNRNAGCQSFLLVALGNVDSKDSLLRANQIQGYFLGGGLGCDGSVGVERRAWERMAPLIIARPDQKGSTGRDNRMFVEGVLWIVRTGSPWRDLPEVFGDWNSVFRRFSRWCRRCRRVLIAPGRLSCASVPLALDRFDCCSRWSTTNT